MKILCVGRNYSEHAKELKNEVPTEPVLFMKPDSSVLRKGEPFFHPDFSQNIHYETELVFRINKIGKHIQSKYASTYFSEFTVGIDFTARDLQDRQKSKGLPWEIAKAFDQSTVLGDFIPVGEFDLSNVSFHLLKNGQMVQKGNSSNMIFPIDKVIEYSSKFFTLKIGDLIFTGTPEGVGKIEIGDHLEGFLEDTKVFDLWIR
ncbi:MAG: fumarylacetoacetate hydrolase family protein [Flavobacteriales bacterium]|nr:fumarylacetoacetate hydrolase family protein [Flavobacteriales bacterium]